MSTEQMRYLIINYYHKANGKIDESLTISKRIKTKDWQTASVILDFKELSVLKCFINGVVCPKDWDTVVAFYYKHYAATIERLFKENGYEIKMEEAPKTDPE